MATGLLKSKLDCSGSLDRAIESLGNNTGNLAFWTAIERLFCTKRVDYRKPDFSGIDNVIITDLIWIREGDSYPNIERLLDSCKLPFIPISVGLQAKDTSHNFTLSEQVVRLLHKIAERATIGVRGEYTATVLEKHSIKNIDVIGCPSMYYWNNPYLKVAGELGNGKLSCNFSTFYHRLSVPEKWFLSYCADRNAQFVEQTKHNLLLEHTMDESYFKYINNWLTRNKEIYLSQDMWINAVKEVDFSMGGRFHANVMALRAGKKALFMANDSRTQEMTAYFQLPTMSIKDFKREQPVEYYYDLADYTAFNKNYILRYNNFSAFCHHNNLQLLAKPIDFV